MRERLQKQAQETKEVSENISDKLQEILKKEYDLIEFLRDIGYGENEISKIIERNRSPKINRLGFFINGDHDFY